MYRVVNSSVYRSSANNRGDDEKSLEFISVLFVCKSYGTFTVCVSAVAVATPCIPTEVTMTAVAVAAPLVVVDSAAGTAVVLAVVKAGTGLLGTTWTEEGRVATTSFGMPPRPAVKTECSSFR